MSTVEALEARLGDLSRVLEKEEGALALLGLGSIGVEIGRLDEWSDLDFFVIVEEGAKPRFLEDCSWLERAHPISYRFRNTKDGFKLLFSDGIFAEMAVFEPRELAAISYSEGRVLWAKPGFDSAILAARNGTGRLEAPPSVEHSLGELMTCLYVGMCRYRRGERLSAWRFIQGYCLDRVLELAEARLDPLPGDRDPYNRDRRFEQRYASWTAVLEGLLLGYDRVPESARFLVEWADRNFGVNQALKAEILELASEGK